MRGFDGPIELFERGPAVHLGLHRQVTRVAVGEFEFDNEIGLAREAGNAGLVVGDRHLGDCVPGESARERCCGLVVSQELAKHSGMEDFMLVPKRLRAR